MARVVLTSSVAALASYPPADGRALTEDDVRRQGGVSFCCALLLMTTRLCAALISHTKQTTQTSKWNETASEKEFAYEYSKTVAEKRAWEIARAQSK